jgi:dynein heavy chain 2
MEDDKRKKYLIKLASNFFKRDANDFQKVASDKELSKFLDDLNTLVLVVNTNPDIKFTTDPRTISSLQGKSLVFYKSKAELIRADNIESTVFISSLADSPMDTLFHLVHNLYAPVIQCQQSLSSKGLDAFDAKLTNNLIDLESNLKVAIRKLESGESNKRSTLSPLDEFQYWADMSERGKSKESKERASFFYSEFKNLIDSYKKIDNCPLNEILEIIEASQDCYDFVWQQVDYDPPYSQDRMTNLLEITGKNHNNRLKTN